MFTSFSEMRGLNFCSVHPLWSTVLECLNLKLLSYKLGLYPTPGILYLFVFLQFLYWMQFDQIFKSLDFLLVLYDKFVQKQHVPLMKYGHTINIRK